MKKILLILSFILITFLSACNKDELSPLEKRIREFDYYTEIVDFDAEGRENIKLLAAYNENSLEVTYIYYMDGIERTDYEVLFYIEGEIAHEDFIVPAYVVDGKFIGDFTGSSLELENSITLAELRLAYPAPVNFMAGSAGTIFLQEFNVVDDVQNVDAINRLFVSTADYSDKDIQVAEVNVVGTASRNAFFISTFIAIIVYIVLLYGYRNVYQKVVEYKLSNPNSNKYKYCPDLVPFKYISAIVLLVMVILSTLISTNVVNNKFESVELYSKYNINYEEIISDQVSLQLGATRYDADSTAFINKDTTHRIMGDLDIEIIGNYNHRAFVPEGSYGAYRFNITYRFLQSERITVQVSEWEWDEIEHYRNAIYYREIKIEGH